MSALANYLKQLDSAESQWGIWVNPKNPTEEYRIGQYCFENGGINDEWIGIGTLESLSFGFQSDYDAFKEAAAQAGHEYDFNELYEAFCHESMDAALHSTIRANIDSIRSEWAEQEVDFFISETLPEILENAKSEVYA